MNDEDEDRALRAHIHDLSFDYALTHLTRDYIPYTEALVAGLLSEYFHSLPVHEPNSLTRPTEPFDDLVKLVNLKSLPEFEEKLVLNRETSKLILSVKADISNRSAIKNGWNSNLAAECALKEKRRAHRPLPAPLLTLQSIRKTPKPGWTGASAAVPASLADMPELSRIKAVEPEVIEDAPPPDLDVALRLRINFDPSTQAGIMALMRSNPSLQSSLDPMYVNPFVKSCLETRPPKYIPTHRESPPPLPRVPQGGTSGKVQSLAQVGEVMRHVEPEVEEEMHALHLAVIDVDGWKAYPSSSSPPASPNHSEELDELLPSTPPTSEPLLLQDLASAKLDEVFISRSRRFGSDGAKPIQIGANMGLGEFLEPLKQYDIPLTVQHPKAIRPPLSPEPSLSMIGAPSDVSGIDQIDELEDFDAILSKTFKHARMTDPGELIMQERLDAKDADMMNVPALPPPNEWSSRPKQGVTSYADLTGARSTQGALEPHDGHAQAYLKEVKGVKSLRMELSWIPFMFGSRKPTHEEVLGVSDWRSNGVFDDGRVTRLTDAVSFDTPDGDVIGKIPVSCGAYRMALADCGYRVQIGDDAVLLNRAERRRLAGLPESLAESDDGADGELMDVEDVPPPPKRPKLLATTLEDCDINDSGIAFTSAHDSLGCEPVHRVGSLVSAEYDDEDKENIPPGNDHDLDDFRSTLVAYRSQEPEPLVDPFAGLDGMTMDDFPDLYRGEVASTRHPCDDQDDPMFSTSSFLADPDEREEDAFVPLSFDSRPSQFWPAVEKTSTPAATSQRGGKLADSATELQDLRSSPACNLTLAKPSLADFLTLRGKAVSKPRSPFSMSPEQAEKIYVADGPPPSLEQQSIPEAFLSKNALHLPSEWGFPRTSHCYLVSLELIQKQMLVRSLRSPRILVTLAERDSLGGVDLILDPHTAVIFASLLRLPSECQALCSRTSAQSWRFSHLLLLLEAYPEQHSHKAQPKDGLAPSAFTPPILKAVQKLRRDLSVAEACGSLCGSTRVHFAFARSVDEAAVFVRMLGDMAESEDQTQGALWGERAWLDSMDEQQDESDLASVEGMNHFAAAVVLCRATLQDLLDLDADVRIAEFGELVGVERMVQFNHTIAHRYEVMSGLLSSEP